MNDRVYIDTSALAKWYLNEKNSNKFADFIQPLEIAAISALTKIEMRCMLAKRRRMKQLSPKLEMKIYSAFESDVDQGHLSLYKVENESYLHAEHLIASMDNSALRTLDAMHLAVVQYYRLTEIATADAVMAKAAKKIGLKVHLF